MFKLQFTPLSAKTVKLLGYQIGYPNEGILRELFREIFVEGIYMFKCDTDKPTIVDCGSNIGMSILFFKKLYPKSHIIAFEPDPHTFGILTENISRNALTEVELHQYALSDRECSSTLYRPNVEDASSLLMNIIGSRAHNSRAVTVSARRLSSFIPERPVDLLKIDIEGGELAVIKEIASAGSMRFIRRIHLEYHHHLQAERDELSSMLHLMESNDFGYQICAAGVPSSSEREFQDMMIYCYNKAIQQDIHGHVEAIGPKI